MRRVMLFAVLLSSSLSLSAWKRQSAFFCQPAQNSTDFEAMPLGLVSRGVQIFRCPLFDDGELNRTTITNLNVHVARPSFGGSSTPVSAGACIQFEAVDGSACGSISSSATVGTQTLFPGVSQWTAFPTDWAYVDVTLCDGCSISGFFTHN